MIRILEDTHYSSKFYNWFGNSKVVDNEGNPLILYHGSKSDDEFTIFNTLSFNEFGSHFGTRPAALRNKSIAKNGSYIYEVYLKIENPLETPDVYGNLYEAARYFMKGATLSHNAEYDKLADLVYKESKRIKISGVETQKDYNKLIALQIRKYIQSLGYDGIKYRNDYEDKGSYSWIVFNPNQIKSVNNKGNYSNNDDIYE